MPETPNHNYNVPDKGDENWHEPLNDNVEQHDTDIEIRDLDSNKREYEPKDGAKFFATDTERIFIGDGDSWTEVQSSGQSPAVEGTVHFPRGEPTTDDIAAGEVMTYTSDGTDGNDLGDLVYAINQGGNVKTQIIGTTDDSKDVFQQAEEEAKKLREAVVSIRLQFSGGFSGGTGWFVDDDKVITNQHVVRAIENGSAEEMYLWTVHGNEVDATIEKIAEGGHRNPDLALLKTSEPAAPYVPPLGDSDTLNPEQHLARVGHPTRVGYWAMGFGRVLSTDRLKDWVTVGVLPVGQGQSGSPIINIDGKVVGTSWATSGRGRGFTPPDEPPEPEPAELKRQYNFKENSEIRIININKILNWMPE